MTISQDLLELTQQTRERVHHVDRLRAEQRAISDQSSRLLAESRRLLDRSFARAWQP